MPLPSGSRLGPYDILGPLGAGGMGEVFRARDSRLGRDVAVKALPQAFAADPERLARFEREARLLASLSHPNIAGIHGLEEKDGQRFLILEFVDGETLAERLKRGPLPLDDALEIAGQVAAALEAAHEAGIVHRDLKPGNIMVTSSGAARVLDFGLAKAGGGTGSSSDQHLSASPTMTYAATAAGVILGTAAYMSPEQARGKAVDRRTDIWSLGCVLFECLSGRMAFGGETISDTIAQILAVEPEWSALPANTPPAVRALLKRCLEKDPKKRLRDAGDVRLFLEEALAGGASGLSTLAPGLAGAAGVAAPAGAADRRATLLPWGVAALALLAAAAGWLLPRGGGSLPPVKPPVRAHLLAPPNHVFTDEPAHCAISPDGRLLAFTAHDSGSVGSLWIRPLGSLEARRVPIPASSQMGIVFWSPDSRHIGYFSDGKLRRVGIDGEGNQALADAAEPRGATWGVSGDILYAPMSGGPIFRVPATGGVPVAATTLDTTSGETAHRYPLFLPDGKRFTYASLPRRGEDIVTWLGELGRTERRKLLAATSSAVFVDDRTILFTRGSALMAQRLDSESLTPVGSPVRIGDSPTNLGSLGTHPVSVSRNGDLVFQERFKDLLYVERYELGGRRLGRFPLPEALWYNLRISPDGRTVALLRSDEQEYGDIWMADAERGQATPLARGERVASTIVWSPDGRELAYMAYREDWQGLFVRSALGASEARLVFRSSSTFKDITDWTPDGRHIVFQDLAAETRRDLWMVPVSGGDPVAIVRGPASETGGLVSGDGRWLAYLSDETGRIEVYVQSFPVAGPRVRVTGNGGGATDWQGSTLTFADGSDLYAADVSGDGDRPELSARRIVWPRIPDAFGGDRFPNSNELLLVVPPEQSEIRFVVLRDWQSLLDTPGN